MSTFGRMGLHAPDPAWFRYLDGLDDDLLSLPPDYDGTKTLPDRGWDGLRPVAKVAFAELKNAAEGEGIEIRMSEGFRPRRRQAYLYAIGRDFPNPDPGGPKIVTQVKPGHSIHQSGLAFDIFIATPNVAPYDEKHLELVGEIGCKRGLTWGGRWKGFRDLPHFEVSA